MTATPATSGGTVDRDNEPLIDQGTDKVLHLAPAQAQLLLQCAVAGPDDRSAVRLPVLRLAVSHQGVDGVAQARRDAEIGRRALEGCQNPASGKIRRQPAES